MTKKILVGICGIGNGHINRQKLIISRLLDYDLDIVLAVTRNSFEYFNITYPEIKKVPIDVPWIYCNNYGIDFRATIEKYIQDGIDQFESFLRFSIEVQNAFGNSNPDFVMTDYEPNVAQFAYATNRPLICFDQHSKFLMLPDDEINNFSINIEISRLLYFFPYADKRYVSSFFRIEEAPQYNIEVIPPILKDIKRAKKINKQKVVVYFSTYTGNTEEYFDILDLICKYDNYRFNIYTEIRFSDYYKYSNLKFKQISDEFDMDLQDCNFIISTAGHQLISEAIYLEIPLFTFPLNTYDQNYCSYIVEKLGFGKRIKDFNSNELNEFIENIAIYRSKMKEYKELNWKISWDSLLFSKLENDYKIEKK